MPPTQTCSPHSSNALEPCLSAFLRGPLPSRASTGCWSCRLRRKKCDDSHVGESSCDDCSRLGIECMLWTAERPAWMKDKMAVQAWRDLVKEQIRKSGRSRRPVAYNRTKAARSSYWQTKEQSQRPSSSSSSSSKEMELIDELALYQPYLHPEVEAQFLYHPPHETFIDPQQPNSLDFPQDKRSWVPATVDAIVYQHSIKGSYSEAVDSNQLWAFDDFWQPPQSMPTWNVAPTRESWYEEVRQPPTHGQFGWSSRTL